MGGIGVGALADRLGPRVAGLTVAIADAACVVGLVVATRADRPTMTEAAIAVGLTQPAVGPLARVHWARLLRGRGRGAATTLMVVGAGGPAGTAAAQAVAGRAADAGGSAAAFLVAPAAAAVALLVAVGVAVAEGRRSGATG